MKIGKELKWKDIKIGQAFYYVGCEGLAVKISDFEIFCIDDVVDTFGVEPAQWGGCTRSVGENNSCYKLYDIPKELKECLESV